MKKGTGTKTRISITIDKELIEQINKENFPSNLIREYYDIIREQKQTTFNEGEKTPIECTLLPL